MSNLVEIKELGKCYGKKKVMNNLSLSLESGRIVGILGPNGSGKSTLIKMMAGVLKPTSGQITINGYPVGVNTKKIVSYLPERTYLNPSMKVKEAVDYFADFYEDFSKQKAPRKHRSGTYGCLQFPADVINWIVFSKKFLLFFVFMIKRTRLCSYNIRI